MVTALSLAEANALFEGVPAPKGEKDDEKEFAMREKTEPPPKTGNVHVEEFPPKSLFAAGSAAEVEDRPLTVLRYSPEGTNVPASHLSITFSLPMVALGTVSNVAENEIPVELSPCPPGRWRWVGTQTLLFEPTHRFPYSTKYKVVVPRGAKSVSGRVLDASCSFSFATPPLRIQRTSPGGTIHHTPLFALAFNQRIDPAAIAGRAFVRAQGSSDLLPLKVADDAALDGDTSDCHQAKSVVKQSTPGYAVVLAFKEDDALVAGKRHEIVVKAGAKSAEGPIAIDEDLISSPFHAYGSFLYQETSPSPSPPFQTLSFSFTNAIVYESITERTLSVSPPIDGMYVTCSGSSLHVHGRTQSSTQYEITFHKGELEDEYGQKLAERAVTRRATTAAQRQLVAFRQGMYIADPMKDHAELAYSFVAVNIRAVKVIIRAASEEDVPAGMSRSNNELVAGKLVSSQTIDIGGEENVPQRVDVPLTAALSPGHKGHVLVDVVESGPGADARHPRRVSAWVQATHLGVDMITGSANGDVHALVTDLRSGEPISGASVKLLDVPRKHAVLCEGKTGPDGTVRLSKMSNTFMAIVRVGEDWASTHNLSPLALPQAAVMWHVFDDRGLYKPNEEVHVKGWLRVLEEGKYNAGVRALPKQPISYELFCGQSKITTGEVRTNAFGGFHLKATLPDNCQLGSARLALKTQVKGVRGGVQHQHTFQVQEFRTPEFEVAASVLSPPTVTDGASAVVEARASYFAGGSLESADVAWSVRSSASSYTPPQWSAYTFGRRTAFSYWERGAQAAAHVTVTRRHHSKLDQDGKHRLAVHCVGSDATPTPVTIRAEASASDINRQQMAASASFVVHPSELYVGSKHVGQRAEAGKPLEVDAVVTSIQGNVVAGRTVTASLVAKEYRHVNNQWKAVEREVASVEVVSADRPVSLPDGLVPDCGGQHEVRLWVADEEGRVNVSHLPLWVAGPMRGGASRGRNEFGALVLINDKEEYEVGDTAHVLVQPPFTPCEGYAVISANDVLRTERISISAERGYASVEVPITREAVPNLHVLVVVNGTAPRADGGDDEPLLMRPASVRSSAELKVSPLSRTLHVEVAPASPCVQPGTETTVEVSVCDGAKKPVAGAEVAVVVVDEAVLSLSGHTLHSPLSSFMRQHSNRPRTLENRSMVYVLNWDDIHISGEMVASLLYSMAGGCGRGGMRRMRCAVASNGMGEKSMRMMSQREMLDEDDDVLLECAMDMEEEEAAEAEAGEAAEVKERTNFSPLAHFEPEAITDANGHATLRITMPDNLTRYRVWAVAVSSAEQYGLGESAIAAKLPLMLRPSLPRFLNFGDTASVSVVVQNEGAALSDGGVSVRIAMRALNATVDPAACCFSAHVPLGRRCEFRFPVRAGLPGTARFQAVVRGVGEGAALSDAATVRVPTWTPAVAEAFATYGEIDADTAHLQKLNVPENAYPQFGGLDVTVSSTALSALTDCFMYLWNYQHHSSEYLASTSLACVALRDVFAAFKVEGAPSAKKMTSFVNASIRKLAASQRGDGSWGWWPSSVENSVFVSLHVTYFLAVAHSKSADGYDVPQDCLRRACQFIGQLKRLVRVYSKQTQYSLLSQALFARSLAGEDVTAEAEALWAEAGKGEALHLEAKGYLLMSVHASHHLGQAIVKQLQNRVNETAETAHFVTSYSDAQEGRSVLLHSNTRTDGVLLLAMMREDPTNPLNVKIVKGLLASRKKGRWYNTQENCACLLALDAYFQVVEKNPPAFDAKVWMNEVFVGKSRFEGHSTDSTRFHVPMSLMTDDGGAPPSDSLPLIVQRSGQEGAGRLYYRVGLTYAPRDLRMPACEAGFSVERKYEGVDRAEDVRRDESGVWHVKAGARVKVTLTMCNTSRRYHVALVDKLPAGLEPMNPALNGTPELPPLAGEQEVGGCFPWVWRRQWFEHQNLRDERAEAYASALAAGVHTYEYIANATTLGSFLIPPAFAEEMYSPEVFGRCEYERMEVE